METIGHLLSYAEKAHIIATAETAQILKDKKALDIDCLFKYVVPLLIRCSSGSRPASALRRSPNGVVLAQGETDIDLNEIHYNEVFESGITTPRYLAESVCDVLLSKEFFECVTKLPIGKYAPFAIFDVRVLLTPLICHPLNTIASKAISTIRLYLRKILDTITRQEAGDCNIERLDNKTYTYRDIILSWLLIWMRSWSMDVYERLYLHIRDPMVVLRSLQLLFETMSICIDYVEELTPSVVIEGCPSPVNLIAFWLDKITKLSICYLSLKSRILIIERFPIWFKCRLCVNGPDKGESFHTALVFFFECCTSPQYYALSKPMIMTLKYICTYFGSLLDPKFDSETFELAIVQGEVFTNSLNLLSRYAMGEILVNYDLWENLTEFMEALVDLCLPSDIMDCIDNSNERSQSERIQILPEKVSNYRAGTNGAYIYTSITNIHLVRMILSYTEPLLISVVSFLSSAYVNSSYMNILVKSFRIFGKYITMMVLLDNTNEASLLVNIIELFRTIVNSGCKQQMACDMSIVSREMTESKCLTKPLLRIRTELVIYTSLFKNSDSEVFKLIDDAMQALYEEVDVHLKLNIPVENFDPANRKDVLESISGYIQFYKELLDARQPLSESLKDLLKGINRCIMSIWRSTVQEWRLQVMCIVRCCNLIDVLKRSQIKWSDTYIYTFYRIALEAVMSSVSAVRLYGNDLCVACVHIMDTKSVQLKLVASLLQAINGNVNLKTNYQEDRDRWNSLRYASHGASGGHDDPIIQDRELGVCPKDLNALVLDKVKRSCVETLRNIEKESQILFPTEPSIVSNIDHYDIGIDGIAT